MKHLNLNASVLILIWLEYGIERYKSDVVGKLSDVYVLILIWLEYGIELSVIKSDHR